MKGRIVRYGKPLDAGDGLLSRMRAMLAIYNSQELPGVTIRIDSYGQTHEVVSDDEGYFEFEMRIDEPLPPTTRWEQVSMSVLGRETEPPSVAVPVMAPGADQNWGIISDIDDTVVETGATNFVKN